ncbi:MAG: NAD-dependent epimerase/dehydratase family protein [Chitinophagales bacterium]|nr:NAD-dependent epimerase/dehydratase family protein [Hyphomicrobiales bacterium]
MTSQKDVQLSEGGRLLGAKVLVTGGAGFVGSNIVDLLVKAGAADIIVIDNMVRGRAANLNNALASGKIRLVEGDIRDLTLMRGLVDGCDVVFHQAALRITHCAAEPRQGMEVMVNATFDLLEMCVDAKIPRVIAASSASVYGLADEFPTTERQNPYNNRTFYGAAKAFNEGLLRSFNDMFGLNYVALRYFNVYGPRMDLHGRYTEVLVRWMERIEQGLPPIIFGDGAQTMDMINVLDVARANILAAEAPVSDAVYNIGDGSETSLKGLAIALASAMGKPHLQPIHEAERAVNPVPRRLADISAAKHDLTFETTIGLEDGLRELVAWWRCERGQLQGTAA